MSTVTSESVSPVPKPEPTALYRNRGSAATDGPAGPGTKAGEDKSVSPLAWAVLLATLGIWAVAGLLLWIPILARESVRFSLALCRSMLLGTEPTEAAQTVKDAADFYRRGFKVAFANIVDEDALDRAGMGGRGRAAKAKTGGKQATRTIYRELAWSFLFWYVALLALGVVQVTPMDGWSAIISLPWSDWSASFVQTIGL